MAKFFCKSKKGGLSLHIVKLWKRILLRVEKSYSYEKRISVDVKERNAALVYANYMPRTSKTTREEMDYTPSTVKERKTRTGIVITLLP